MGVLCKLLLARTSEDASGRGNTSTKRWPIVSNGELGHDDLECADDVNPRSMDDGIRKLARETPILYVSIRGQTWRSPGDLKMKFRRSR